MNRLTWTNFRLWPWIYLVALFTVWTAGMAGVQAAERVALVIGNGGYQHAKPLANPTRDAAAVSKLLRDAGFEVVTVEDAGVEEMYLGMEKFKKAAAGARVGLFYYAGHGMEVDGKNFLLPVDAVLESPVQLRTQTVSLDTVLNDMKAVRLPAKLVILDCCRDNPLTRSWMATRSNVAGGLIAVPDASIPEATMIMYASAPGQVALDGTGGNSPFTAALVKHLAEPGVSAFDAFLGVSDAVAKSTGERQVPWIKFDGAGRTFRLFALGREGTGSSSGSSTRPEVMVEPPSQPGDAMEGKLAGDSMRNALGMKLRWCPAGEFWMGSPETEKGRFDDEVRHKVSLSQGFWLGQYEVTQGEWEAVMGRSLRDQARLMLEDDTVYTCLPGDPATLREFNNQKKDADPTVAIGTEGGNIPIYLVNWEEATEFCRELTERERRAGKLPENWEYRLPTEAEWEYACRAGTSTTLYTGALTIKGDKNGPELDEIAWYGGNSSVDYEGRGWSTDDWAEKQYPGGRAGPREVGQKAPNDWGLYDMIGNMFEWCQDWYGDYPQGYAVDPKGVGTGTLRVARGGSWENQAYLCRSALRDFTQPTIRIRNWGFRVALSPSVK